jgi:hypothetical protein
MWGGCILVSAFLADATPGKFVMSANGPLCLLGFELNKTGFLSESGKDVAVAVLRLPNELVTESTTAIFVCIFLICLFKDIS